jgi:hypothetical protein
VRDEAGGKLAGITGVENRSLKATTTDSFEDKAGLAVAGGADQSKDGAGLIELEPKVSELLVNRGIALVGVRQSW